MAKVVFALTDAQVRLLAQINRHARVDFQTDPRTLAALKQKLLIAPIEPGEYRPTAWALTLAGKAAIALCERLASLKGLLSGK
jgi:hypothetical protein